MPRVCMRSLVRFTGRHLSTKSSCVVLTRICSLANQEVLRWQMSMQKELGDNISHDHIKEYLWRTLKSGQVVPG